MTQVNLLVWIINFVVKRKNECISKIQEYSEKKTNAIWENLRNILQKQPSRGVLREKSSENMQQITGERPYRSVISIKLLCNFTETTLRHGCSPVNLQHIFSTPTYKNTYGGLLITISTLVFSANLFFL